MSTAVSAPGKVLLAGGYLVLDRTYTGLVFGLSARIHVLVDDITATEKEDSEIVVQSPQFREATWTYGYHLSTPIGDRGGIKVVQKQGSSESPISRNPFVEIALAYALTYISAVLPTPELQPVKITILADNDYYSTSSANATSFSSASHNFTNFNIPLKDAHKTGLGSSAALVTSLTGALLTHYLPSSLFSLTTPEGRTLLHNLSQASHCYAQGKVGSGFDVAAAVYGTCIYRRFSPSILSALSDPGTPNFSTRLKELVNNTYLQKWDTEISKEGVTIPKGLSLIMCDVDCGSQTVGMVKQVLSWKSASPDESRKLWDDLHLCNTSLAKHLSEGNIKDLPAAFSAIRTNIRAMGKLSGVEIEPAEQTELLDAITHDVEGVEGGVVPGAGGYDAICLVVKDDAKTMEDVRAFLEMWSAESKSTVKLLDVKGELEGARVEDAGSYGGF